MKKLNEKQKEIVAANYGLIWKFCRIHNIDKDEYSDILSIAWCESVLLYDETKSKLTFSTFAFHRMNNKLIDEYRKNNAKEKRIPLDKLVYGDGIKDEDESNLGTIFDNISSMEDIEEVIIYKDMVNQLRNTNKFLTDRQKQMLDCLLAGLSNKQSQLVLNLSLKRTEQIKHDLKGRISSFLECY